MFQWEYYQGEDAGWVPVELDEEEADVLGMPEIGIKTTLPDQDAVETFGIEDDPFPIPEALREEKLWIRGTVDYERWLAHRMIEDLEISWRDDRGGEERKINNWEVRNTGRTLEYFIQDMPPIRGGWTVTFTMIDRGVSAGRNGYLPRYRWQYRRGDQWEEVPDERVRLQGTSVILTGPFTEMSTDGYNLRAERVETVFLRGFIQDLELEMTWLRPVEVFLAAGPETGAAGPIDNAELPIIPYQPAPTLPPLLGMKLFIGSDLFDNRAQKSVLLEMEIDFEMEGESIEEPKDKYHMQLTYRAGDTWRVLYTEEGTFSEFTFAELDPEGALQKGKRKIRILIDPKKQLKGLHRAVIAGQESTWLRLEMTRAQMTHQEDKKSPPIPITLKIHSVKLGVDGVLGKEVYEQPMPGLKVATVEYRAHNRRLSRSIARSAGRLSEDYPFDTFIDISDESGGKKEDSQGHQAVYFKLDKPIPPGNRHAIMFKTRGETFLPEGTSATWEVLEADRRGRQKWTRIVSSDASEDGAYSLNRSGVLAFPLQDPLELPPFGMWVRALLRAQPGEEVPALPPLSHMLLNTTDSVNLHAMRMEKFSGLGIPQQEIQLRRYPIFLHSHEAESSEFANPDRFADIRVYVTEEDGVRREWRRAPGNSIVTASKDDRLFLVDPVDGTLTFGNGIRGKMLPVGDYNVTVEVYHTVPGSDGNVAPGDVVICEGFGDVVAVSNVLPASGGRNAESIEEIIVRAPSILTSRDRAVTRLDFEVIANESSAEVARAACDGHMGDDGEVGVVILPNRREGERVPDAFLAAGLKDHVGRYLGRRCLVNVQPIVRLATFQEVDVSITLRLRPNANMMQVRDKAKGWVARFLDPYVGGLDRQGWPFGGTLYAQDFGRMVRDIPEVRHVVDVQLYEIPSDKAQGVPGWEEGQGARTLVLDKADLFILRRVRVNTEEGSS